MKRHAVRVTMLSAILCLVSGAAQAQEAVTKEARAAVESWLALIDSQKYAASWEAAAAAFQKAVTQEQWQAAVKAVRAPLGERKSRTLKNAMPRTNLPGAPDGTYVVFQFDAVYEEKAAAVETVTAMQAEDGRWKVAGYFIK